MAWEIFHRFESSRATLNFDFTRYKYRVIGEPGGTLTNHLGFGLSAAAANRFAQVERSYTDLVEGMSANNGTTLSQGDNEIATYTSGAYLIPVIERFLLNTEPGQPGPFTNPSASETLRIGETYRFEWGASFDPDLSDTVYYRVFTKSNEDAGYMTGGIVTTTYWDYTIPEGITSLSLRVYPFNDTTPNELDNVPRDSPEYLVSSGFELYPKVGGVVRETEKAWVKVNGQLREVDGVWVKANYGTKEV